MFNHVIIGIDGFGRARDLASTVKALAPSAVVTLVTVYPQQDAAGRSELYDYDELLQGDAIRMLEEERITANLPAAELLAVPDSSPARGLKRAAAGVHADLIVVGPSDRSQEGRIELGEVSRGVFHGAPCPVLAIPRGGEPADGPCVVGSAFDGSTEATHALQLAAGIAAEHGARLEVVEAIDNRLSRVFEGPDLTTYVENITVREQERLEATVADLGVKCHAEAVPGDPHEVLRDLAQRVDLMVCGSRGWGPAARVAFGSAADELIHDARCPVLVVPRGVGVVEHHRSLAHHGAVRPNA